MSKSVCIRNDNYGMYSGTLYRVISVDKSIQPYVVDLASNDKADLKKGFENRYSDFVTKKYGFVCNKKVFISEITEAYEIRTSALYREKCYVYPWHEDIQLIVDFDRTTEADKIKEIKSWGFTELQYERTTTTFEKIVSVDDPELEIIEERKPLDINKL
ncbi:hypothetical protein [Huintestinicola sp.]|uniref:hypothetical protein n=1 Tax=Huintestinicola sp. TaxID=2981661 RepID=UPI003D7D9ACC